MKQDKRMNIRSIGRGTLLALICFAPLARADEQRNAPPNKASRVYQIPYKLTDTEHVLVRIKINGKGPFNFIVDTGAPLLYVSVPVAKKIGLEADKKGAATIDRLEIEGGPAFTKFQCHVEPPFQLTGMNAMGMAGTELHGM